jgi:hypothetical protein
MEDEIEAFLSVYFDNAVCTDQPDNTKTLIVIARPDGATATTSFVEALLQITLPLDYPESFPETEITRTSGLSDEGRALKLAISEFMKDQFPGDLILFQLMDCVIACLDSANNGECMICLDSLIPKGITDVGLVSLRTSCYHCFHVDCLCHWAAVCISAEQQKKSETEERTDQRHLRALQGDVRSSTMQVQKLESELSLIQEQIVVAENDLAALYDEEGAEVSDKLKLERLKQRLGAVTASLSKGSAMGKKKAKLLEEANILRGEINRLESVESGDGSGGILTYADRKEVRREERSEEGAPQLSVVQLQSRLADLRRSYDECEGRRKKVTDR